MGLPNVKADGGEAIDQIPEEVWENLETERPFSCNSFKPSKRRGTILYDYSANTCYRGSS